MQSNSELDTKRITARHRLTVIWTWVGIILLFAVAVFLSGPLSNAIGIVVWTVVAR